MTVLGSPIDTAVGPADVLHRVALVVECIDSSKEQRLATPVRIGREVSPVLLARGYDPSWPCFDLTPRGPGRAVIVFDWQTPVTSDIAVRIVDPSRRYVARRLAVPPWTLTEIVAAEQNPPAVRAGSRLLRVWLSPGSAYRAPRGATTIRGRVSRNSTPVRWPRVTALGPGNQAVGWAHGDERGEFLLSINDTGTLPPPAPSTLPVKLEVIAPDPATLPAVQAVDDYDDLVVEVIARSADPPTPADLDNAVLRGRTTPTGYVANTAAVAQLQVPIGGEMTLTTDIPFAA